MSSLVVAPAWIGDMVMAHCLVQRIHAAEPDAPIHILAPPATAAIAERMAEVSTVHRLAIGHGEFGLGKRWRMGRELSQLGFARSYVLPNSWKSALVPFFARVPRRTGWLGEARRGLLNDTQALPAEQLPLMIERFMALQNLAAAVPGLESLAKPYPQPVLQVDGARQRELIATHDLIVAENTQSGAVALCPGAEFGQAKRWPEAHFVQVATSLVQAGRQVWLLGGPADVPVCEAILQGVMLNLGAAAKTGSSLVNLAGKTSLADAVDLLAAASAVVCNDSGLMHVASAVDTPAIALYGSTSPGFTPPLHKNALALTLVTLDGGRNKLDCQPCFQRECRFDHGDCLVKLTPDRVEAQLATLGLLPI